MPTPYPKEHGRDSVSPCTGLGFGESQHDTPMQSTTHFGSAEVFPSFHTTIPRPGQKCLWSNGVLKQSLRTDSARHAVVPTHSFRSFPCCVPSFQHLSTSSLCCLTLPPSMLFPDFGGFNISSNSNLSKCP